MTIKTVAPLVPRSRFRQQLTPGVRLLCTQNAPWLAKIPSENAEQIVYNSKETPYGISLATGEKKP